MNEHNLHYSIKESISSVLTRLPELEPEDRCHLLMERIEWVLSDFDLEDQLLVPQFQTETDSQ